MSAGYGRGYYGAGQLARSSPRKRSWFTIVAVLGVGSAVVWLLWPRKAVYDLSGSKEPERPTPAPSATSPLVVINTTSAPFASGSGPAVGAAGASITPLGPGAFLKQLEDDARARNFISVKDYEDSVIASAKQLQAAGAQVVLAPHLQHLAPQLG